MDGADPGPACYGEGNEEPTVTDANVVLQTLNPGHLLGGRMKIRRISPERAVGTFRRAAASRHPANRPRHPVGRDRQHGAPAPSRVNPVQRGHDPRDYTLMGISVAPDPCMRRVGEGAGDRPACCVPQSRILCAIGLLLTNLRADFALTRLLPATEASTADVADAFAALSQRAERWSEHEAIAPAQRRLARTVDMRYHGQNYELSVAAPTARSRPRRCRRCCSGFADVHRQRYGFAADGDPVQLVTLRVEATGTVRKAELKVHPDAGPDASAAIADHRPVWLAETRDFTATPVYARASLRPGNRFAGPAIVEQMDATTLVPPGTTARVDAYLNLILEAGS